MQEQPRRASAVPSPISAGNKAPSLSPKNNSESTANGSTPVPTSGRTSQMSSPKSQSGAMSPVQEEIQRVRKQIEDMALELKDAFASEKYDDVRTLGEKKKDLEDKLKSFEEQYSNDKHELQGVKSEIAEVETEMKAAFESESYTKVSELGKRKQDLKTKLAELESSFGLHNAVYQVGDRVSVVGLKSPRGGNYNGVTGTITEYIDDKQRYKVNIKGASGEPDEDKLIAVSGRNLKACDTEAQSGQSKTRALQGEIKLWFPRKHFGFITPDNKPEGEPDIFFHGTHVDNRKAMPIKRFARVRFSVIPAPKGPQARDVTIIGYQPEKEAEAEKQAALATGSRNSPGSPGRMNSPRRPNNGMSSPARHNAINVPPRHASMKPPDMHANLRKTPPRRPQQGRSPRDQNPWGRGNGGMPNGLMGGQRPVTPPNHRHGRSDDSNWRPQMQQNVRRQHSPQKPTGKRPPPGYPAKNPPPGLSPIRCPPGDGMPMSGGLPPANLGQLSGQMQSLDSDDEFSNSHAPHPAAQRPNVQSGRQRSYESSRGPPGRHPQAPASHAKHVLRPTSRQQPLQKQGSWGHNGGNLTRLTTDELPSFELSPLQSGGKWSSIMSTESMHFSDNPSPLGPVSARGENPNPNGAWRPPKQDSPRERLIRRAEQLNINNSFRRGGPS